MRILAFDGRMGASGDMLLGSLVAAGADPTALAPIERALGVEYDVDTTTRNGIEATDVTVFVADRASAGREGRKGEDDRGKHPHDTGDENHQHGHGDGEHSHDTGDEGHQHGHGDHDHTHGTGDNGHQHDHRRTTLEGTGPHRSFSAVVDVVESIDVPETVLSMAIAVFERLATAEAAVHGTTIDDIHFHEVGADDAIADVVGVVTLLADLAPERIVTTPVATGRGAVEMAHGVYPIPPPAVVKLAEDADWALRGGPVEAELLTPTGAALLAEVAEGVESLPPMQVESAGYGAGDATFESHPNVLRAIVGLQTSSLGRESISVLETNVDDVTPEILGGLQETLLSAGARDVTILPATMKKSRPGHLVKVVVRPEQAHEVARTLALETGTLGIREHGKGHRFVADREIRDVSLEIDGESYDVGVKVARFAGDEAIFDLSAEFDDALAVAEETDLSVRAVIRRAEAVASDEFERSDP